MMTIHTRATSAPFSTWSNLRKSLYTGGSATRRVRVSLSDGSGPRTKATAYRFVNGYGHKRSIENPGTFHSD